jgi:hypothetical protein
MKKIFKVVALLTLSTHAYPMLDFRAPEVSVKAGICGALYSTLMSQRIGLPEKLIVSGMVALGGYTTPNKEEVLPAFLFGTIVATGCILHKTLRRRQRIQVGNMEYEVV